MQNIVNLLNEVGMLAYTPRSGFAFLGTGNQSVADHTYRMTIVAYILSSLTESSVDKQKLLLMCLFHDLPEARTGDHNYVNKRYVKTASKKVVDDISKSSSFGPEIANYIQEYDEGKSLESQLAHDADQIELILMLKDLSDKGNPRALDWLANAVKRLKTDAAKKMAEEIRCTPSDLWWNKDKEDPHWINGGKDH